MSSLQPPLIVTDSTCDLPPALYERYDIQLVPLQILFGQESYRSNLDMDLMQFVERLHRGDVHPSSSQPTVADFVAMYESLMPSQRPILSIHISEGLSGTVNAARQAARQFPDYPITVWDSQTISAALGFHVLTAARAAEAGADVESIMPRLERLRREVNLLFSLNDLSFLARGGRIGQVQYRVGQALNIKPIVTVSKSGATRGTYVSAGRVRSLDKAVDEFVKLMLKDVPAGSKIRAMGFHGVGKTPGLIARLEEQIRAHFDCVFFEAAYSTPVLGVHVGPLALDVGYVAGDWDI